ncbi:TIGR04282 family arsenosugar biosynthesis glycosyltransferase [Synechococcus sp. UW86]|uniref:TIGR04282 family arsenosugar biosynthesis glycosyltransferase n=1 Tax=Synechococcus sp. UW86 TaxID=368491 RepID=UPI000E0E4059|nr:TIGR04282 family arsenosugar biosynthesis glycosyltransferase [Synechococcus sp. UW86]
MVQIVVMARWPSPGRCKRRLSRDLIHELGLANSSERATRIQRRLTQHTAAVVRGLAAAMEIEPVLAVSGLGTRAATRWGQQLGLKQVRLQGKGQLGTRLRRQLMHGHRQNRPCLVIGTDLPELNPDDLRQAVERLKQHDLVLGPASDGGYWLLGIGASLIRSPQHWPLIGIPWGGPSVLEATLEAARRQQLSSALVPQRNDLDHWSDLMPWQG